MNPEKQYQNGQTVLCQMEEDGKAVSEKWYTAKVEGFCLPPKKGQGELMYCWSYNRPFPQMIVTFENGHQERYCGQDAIDKFVKTTEKEFKENVSLQKLMDSVTVVTYFEEEHSQTLTEACKNILPFIQPLLDKPVHSLDEDRIALGEFDSTILTITSVAEGKAMRNSGSKAFVLKIRLDGYAPNTFELKINETYFWC